MKQRKTCPYYQGTPIFKKCSSPHPFVVNSIWYGDHCGSSHRVRHDRYVRRAQRNWSWCLSPDHHPTVCGRSHRLAA